MSDEGTKPAEGEETKLEAPANGTPAEGTAAGTAEPSQAEQQPSEDWRKKYEDAVRGMNDAQRRAAERDAENERLRHIAEAAMGRVQAQEDPEAAAYKAWQEGYYTGDAPELHRRYLEAREQKRFAQFGDNLMKQFELRQKMPAASAMLGINDERSLAATLHGVAQTYTPDELALIELKRRGKLEEYLHRSREQREADARRASALDQFGSIRGAPRIPGSPPDGDAKLIPFEEWAAASDEAKQRLRQSKDKFVVVGAPKHFDPTRD